MPIKELRDPGPSALDELLKQEEMIIFNRCLKKLSLEQKRAIGLRLGSPECPPLPTKEIAVVLGITQRRARRLVGQSMSLLAKLIKEETAVEHLLTPKGKKEEPPRPNSRENTEASASENSKEGSETANTANTKEDTKAPPK
jgi:hypothetical protein